jgi:hypothetical protein
MIVIKSQAVTGCARTRRDASVRSYRNLKGLTRMERRNLVTRERPGPQA